MTNEKVIEQLKDMQSRCTNGYDAKAINKAIKVLEERPIGEWIPIKIRELSDEEMNKWLKENRGNE